MSLIFFNNDFFDSDQCPISVNDRGFLLGDGLFETIQIYSGKAIFLKQHWERLILGASVLEIPVPIDFEKLIKIIDELTEKNNLKNQEASLRLTLTRGVGPRGINFPNEVKPTILAAIFPLIPKKEKMISALISTIRRNEHSPLARIKSLNYLDNILARREAEKAGFDEALLLNTQGKVCEATTANLFFVKDKVIYTPPIEDGALPGITREIILNVAEKIGLKTRVISFTEKELLSADEAFLTNSIQGISPMRKINDIIITEKPGSITTDLSQALVNI